jgi:transposase
MRCTATTSRGSQCRRSARVGSERCHAHSGEDVGRPEKLTDEVLRRICEAVRAGTTKEVAAEYVGVSRSTLHRWVAKGAEEGSDPRYRKLAQELRRAEAGAEVHAAAILRRAMPDDWRAAVAYLERRHRPRWSKHALTPARETEHAAKAHPDIDVTDPATRGMLSEILRRSANTR